MKTLTKRFTTNARLLKEHLNKYKDTFQAFKELINNSIQAESKSVQINIEYNPAVVSGIEALEIADDGYGVSLNEFEKKILEVGTTVKPKGLGIGRFSALQIGELMHIETVAYDKVENQFTLTKFSIDVIDLQDTQLEIANFKVDYELLGTKKHKTYYKVRIEKLYHNNKTKFYKVNKRNEITKDFFELNIKATIFINYPSEIFNEKIFFKINENPINKKDFVIGIPKSKTSNYKTLKGEDQPVNFEFYNIQSQRKEVKVFFQIENAGIRSVGSEYAYSSDWFTPELGTWFVYLDSSLLTGDLFRNLDIEAIDKQEKLSFEAHIINEINQFFKEENKVFRDFISRLENDKFYPYKLNLPPSQTQEILFKKVAFILENQHSLIKKDVKIREFLYAILDRAIGDGNIEYIFKQVHELSEETLPAFTTLLSKTGLEDIVHFNNQVAEKLQFVEFLHKIIYTSIAKTVKERSQLHKIIEKHLWLFGEQYNGTPYLWSDKNIGNILEELRIKHLKTELVGGEDSNIIETEEEIEGLSNITDLFFLNEKISDDGYREIMVVELKAPSCAISAKELDQISKYAYTIEQHTGLPNEKVKYKLLLISSKLTAYAKSQVKSKRKMYPDKPFLFDLKTEKDIEISVMTWAELIESNKRKLGYLSNKLNVKDKSVASIFEEEYSHLVDDNLAAELKLSKKK